MKEVSRKRLGRKVLDRARGVRLMVFDVDGVLTDGTLLYGPSGEEMKTFHALDGHGIKMLAEGGIACALLSGRRSAAVAVRAAELGIEHVLQGIENKLPVFLDLARRKGLGLENTAYMGDELVDLPVLTRCGFACAPREAPEAVRSRVHYIAAAPAGRGAAREVCELVLRAQRKLDRVVGKYLA